jgi:hypothetical protein
MEVVGRYFDSNQTLFPLPRALALVAMPQVDLKNPPVGAVGDVKLKFLWPHSRRDAGFRHLNKAYRGHSAVFTMTRKETRLVSGNTPVVCYVGTVPECKVYQSEDLAEVWTVCRNFVCRELSDEQKGMDPVVSEDILVVGQDVNDLLQGACVGWRRACILLIDGWVRGTAFTPPAGCVCA